MKKLVKESLNENLDSENGVYTPSSKEDQIFLDKTIKEIQDISTIEEMNKYVTNATMHHAFPFNPPDPLRTICREKLKELTKSITNKREELIINSLLSMVEGDWKEINLPDGAMY